MPHSSSSIPILPPPILPPPILPPPSQGKNDVMIPNPNHNHRYYASNHNNDFDDFDFDDDGQNDNDENADNNHDPQAPSKNDDNDGNDIRPSGKRRKRLSDELAIPTVSNFFPIERYYDTAQIAYDAVIDLYHDGNDIQGDTLDEIYLFGKRYCYFIVNAIPNHNYYNSPTKNGLYRTYKQKHTKQVMKILSIIEKVNELMDQEEILRQQALEQQRKQQQREEEERMIKKFHSIQQRIENLKQNDAADAGSNNNIAQAALSKLALLSSSSSVSTTTIKPPKLDPPHDGNNHNGRKTSTRYGLHVDDSEEEVVEDDDNRNGSDNTSLPPPMLPPPNPNLPPSYDAVVNQGNKRTSSSSSSSSASIRLQNKQQATIPVQTLQEQYRMKFNEYQKLGKIHISTLDTYQGRVYDSTNGCTVISALVAATHLQNHRSNDLDNTTICNIIDTKCGPILRQIRSKLGLSGAALIIPSDVHDHFVDHKLFRQEQFVGVAGGNVLDKQHYGEFLRLLACGEKGTTPHHHKASATFFYHEHVISIMKIPTRQNNNSNQVTSYYDFIDSLPTVNGKATRTRCYDIQSLEILLQYFTLNKLSPQNCQYINRRTAKWDDTMADIDPRVFQGFVWMNPKQ